MSTITTRSGKGSPLTHDEVDANFNNLNTDKIEDGGSPSFVNITVSGTVDGRDIATDGTKLDGIEASATADQSAAEIKTAYESNSDTNAFTDADHTKLDGIEASADVTDGTNVTAAGALMDSEVANLAQVKAFDSTDYATAAQGTLANSAVQLGDSPSFAGLTVDTDTLAVDSTNNRVGIGTTSPAEPLDVVGTIGSNVSSTGDFNFKATSTGGGQYRIYPDDATTANPTWLHQTNSSEDQAFVIGGVERVRIDSSGKVGIGTASPSRTLHIKNTAAAVRLEDTDQAGVYHEIIESSGQLDIRADHGNTSTTGNMLFSVGGSERMRIDSAGNVGIGTTSPANKLEVTGAIVAQGAATAYTNTGLYLQNKGSSVFDVGAWRSGASVADLTFSTDSGSDAAPVERMRINSSGNVGIGTTSPSGMLHLSGALPRIYFTDTDTSTASSFSGENGWLILTAASSRIIFNIAGSEHMRIDSSGRVGIGTASPAATVDVSGNARGAVVTDNDLSFDLSASNNFNCTPTGGGTLTFTNHLAGQSGFVWLDNSGGHAIAAAGTTKINAADLTAISTAGVYTLAYFDNGTNAYVSVSRSFA